MRQEEKRQAGTPVRNGRNWISRAGFACAVWALVLAAGNGSRVRVCQRCRWTTTTNRCKGPRVYTFVFTITLDGPAPANGLTVNYTLSKVIGRIKTSERRNLYGEQRACTSRAEQTSVQVKATNSRGRSCLKVGGGSEQVNIAVPDY